MKTINCNVEKLVECYQWSTEADEKAEVLSLAKKILDSRNFECFLDKCISIDEIDILMFENQLGLSGVQNKDNL